MYVLNTWLTEYFMGSIPCHITGKEQSNYHATGDALIVAPKHRRTKTGYITAGLCRNQLRLVGYPSVILALFASGQMVLFIFKHCLIITLWWL